MVLKEQNLLQNQKKGQMHSTDPTQREGRESPKQLSCPYPATCARAHTYTHTPSLSLCLPPTFTLEEEGHSGPMEDREMGRRGWARYWEVVNIVRQYLHGSPHTVLKHLIPLHQATAPNSLSKAKCPESAPRLLVVQ